jgi:hypothetical protein
MTESVVLPPFIGGVQYDPIHAAGPTNAAVIAPAMDGCDYRSPLGLVVLNLVYLAGLQWPSLIPGGRRTKQVVAELGLRSVTASCFWRRAEPKRRF